MTRVVIDEFKRVTKNTLKGFVRAQFPSGMVMAEIGVHIDDDGNAWASPPSRPMLDRDGAAMRDRGGKPRWQPLISFTSGRIRTEWSRQIIDALLAQFPDALS